MECLGRTVSSQICNSVAGEGCVTVVITCYNQAAFLADSIESVSQQGRNTELIVVDDGSTDDTAAIARRFSGVRYIRQKNQGVSVARNTGLSASKGDHLIFLDADDRLSPNAIEAGMECFRRNPCSGFVVGRYRKIDANGTSISEPNRICGDRDFYSALLKANVVGMLSTVLFKRAALEKVGGFDPRFRASEDYDILLRMARNCAVNEHDNLVAEYRWHDRNMSLDYLFMLQDSIDALRAQWPHAKGDPAHRQALKTGIANWRRHYSSLIFSDIVKEIKAEGFQISTLRRVLRMAGTAPAMTAAFARRALEWVSTVQLPR